MTRRYLLIAFAFCSCHSATFRPSLSDTTEKTVRRGDSLLFESGSLGRRSVVFPDSTSAILNPGTSVAYAGRGARLDGDAFIDASRPFTIHTRNLVLTGAGAIRVSAFAKDEGESAEVLTGSFTATKSYTSPDNETDTLIAGNMVMINRSIDLMEKETYDTTELAVWRAGTLTFVHTPFDSVVRRLQDWFGVSIEVHGDLSAAAPFTGSFPHAHLEQVLDALHCKYSVRRYIVTIEL
jgi:ferric-dicitrate binding protein FerR (iron transport regulator)